MTISQPRAWRATRERRIGRGSPPSPPVTGTVTNAPYTTTRTYHKLNRLQRLSSVSPACWANLVRGIPGYPAQARFGNLIATPLLRQTALRRLSRRTASGSTSTARGRQWTCLCVNSED
jgi:hypothetical protein